MANNPGDVSSHLWLGNNPSYQQSLSWSNLYNYIPKKYQIYGTPKKSANLLGLVETCWTHLKPPFGQVPWSPAVRSPVWCCCGRRLSTSAPAARRPRPWALWRWSSRPSAAQSDRLGIATTGRRQVGQLVTRGRRKAKTWKSSHINFSPIF